MIVIKFKNFGNKFSRALQRSSPQLDVNFAVVVFTAAAVVVLVLFLLFAPVAAVVLFCYCYRYLFYSPLLLLLFLLLHLPLLLLFMLLYYVLLLLLLLLLTFLDGREIYFSSHINLNMCNYSVQEYFEKIWDLSSRFSPLN